MLAGARSVLERTVATRLGPFTPCGGRAERTAGSGATLPAIASWRFHSRLPGPACGCTGVTKCPACSRKHGCESCDPSNDGGRGEERGSYPPLYFFGFRLEITCLFLYLPVSLQAEAHAILTRTTRRTYLCAAC